MPGVDWYIPLKQLGDTVVADGSTARNFCKIGISGKTRTEVYQIIDRIQHTLDIQDENGNNLVIKNVPKGLLKGE